MFEDSLSLGPWNISMMVIYMVAIVFIGLWFSKNEKTSEDYLLGGRNIPWWAVGMSYMMSLLSTVSLVQTPGEIFNNGMTYIMLGFLLPVMSILGFFIFVRFYFKLKLFTPFAYLEKRYDSSVRLLSTVLYLWIRTFYMAMVLFASSKVFEGAAGWPVWFTVLLVGIIGIVYTMMGGLRAVVWTDVLQFFVFFGGLIFAVYFCTRSVDGGFMGVMKYSFSHGRGPELYADPQFYAFNPYVRLCFWLLLAGAVMEPIFYNCTDQITIQRLLATDSYKSATKAVYTNSIFMLPGQLLLCYIGLAIFTYYRQNPDPNVTSGDTAFFTFIATKMPAPVPGLMLAAMLAAGMSTLDSGMNSLSSVFVKDIYVRYWNKTTSELKQVSLSRYTTLAIGLFAMAFALLLSYKSEKLKETFVEVWAVFGAFTTVLAPIYILAVTTKRITPRAVWIMVMSCWGLNFGMVTWYLCSKSGFTTPLPATWVIASLAVSAAILVIGSIMNSQKIRGAATIKMISICPLGYAASLFFWYLMSHYSSGGDLGYMLSFAWIGAPSLVVWPIIGYGSLLFTKQPEAKKHVGLTLWTAGKDVIQ